MVGVTNDFTDTAKSSPMTLEEKAPAPRTKPFEKQGQIKRQATLDTSNEPHGTENVGKTKINLRSFKLNRVYLDLLNMPNKGDFSWS